MDQAYFVAAPLLAGVALAAVGILVTDGDKFRWPGPGVTLLTLSSILLIASIQLAFHGRQYLYSPAELSDWWDGELTPATEVLQEEQREDFSKWAKFARRAAVAYNSGIVLLGYGMVGLLAPPGGVSPEHSVTRWIAVGFAVVGASWELGSMVRHAWRSLRSHT